VSQSVCGVQGIMRADKGKICLSALGKQMPGKQGLAKNEMPAPAVLILTASFPRFIY